MDQASLNMLRPGERGTVTGFAAPVSTARQRLLEMGLTRGTSVEILRYAPMGDPIEVKVKGYRLSLRRDEAALILVQKDDK
jgi:ferrous iron transport protein A